MHNILYGVIYLLLSIVLLVLVSALANLARSKKFKGQLGEFVVSRLLTQLGPGWEVLHDLTFVMDDGETTQIDHVVLSCKGIFVIETKNFEGSISGRAEDAKWTQMLGRNKFSFQNPMRQNFRHVRFLAVRLGVNEAVLKPMVVFMNGVKFPKGCPEGVYFPNQLVRAIKGHTETCLNNAQMGALRSKLERLGATTTEKTAIHLQSLKERHQSQMKPSNSIKF